MTISTAARVAAATLFTAPDISTSFFDLFLLAFQLEQLLLRFLDLLVQMLRRKRFLFAEFEHLFDRSDFIGHDDFYRSARCCPPPYLARWRFPHRFSICCLEFGIWNLEFARQRPGIISSSTPLKYSVSGIVGSTG